MNLGERLKDDDEVPTGLKNVGNTCYFNSLLQDFFMLPVLSQMIIETKEISSKLIPARADDN